MFGLFGFDPNNFLEKQREEMTKLRLGRCVPWDPQMKWNRHLNLQAATYQPRNLFPEVIAYPHNNVNEIVKAGTWAESPHGEFVYVVKRLAKGVRLQTVYGKQRGDVLWDGEVDIPALHEQVHGYDGRWEKLPWMSITPNEIISLRGGQRAAKGHVVVAGLGLGHQLIEVSQKPSVKKITLVERSAELVGWILPRIRPFLRKDVELVVEVGDAYDVVPTLTADVALIDIYKRYGSNSFRRYCPHIQRIWVWGSSHLNG